MKIHVVKKGDTLFQLAQKYHVDLEKIIELNPQIADPNQIDVGMKVKIPSPPVIVETPGGGNMYKHIVQQGDTLWKLSKAAGIPLDVMIAANPQLKNPSVLLTGEVVYIPKHGVAPGEGAAGHHVYSHPGKKVSTAPNQPAPILPEMEKVEFIESKVVEEVIVPKHEEVKKEIVLEEHITFNHLEFPITGMPMKAEAAKEIVEYHPPMPPQPYLEEETVVEPFAQYKVPAVKAMEYKVEEVEMGPPHFPVTYPAEAGMPNYPANIPNYPYEAAMPAEMNMPYNPFAHVMPAEMNMPYNPFAHVMPAEMNMPYNPCAQVMPAEMGIPYNPCGQVMPANLGAMPANMGAMPSNLGAMPANMGAMPSNLGAMPANMGAMPSNLGAMPANMGAMPSNLGALPANIGAMPANLGAMPANIGALPVNIGAMPANLGALPANIGAMPANLGAMPANMAAMPANLGAMPANMPMPFSPYEAVMPATTGMSPFPFGMAMPTPFEMPMWYHGDCGCGCGGTGGLMPAMQPIYPAEYAAPFPLTAPTTMAMPANAPMGYPSYLHSYPGIGKSDCDCGCHKHHHHHVHPQFYPYGPAQFTSAEADIKEKSTFRDEEEQQEESDQTNVKEFSTKKKKSGNKENLMVEKRKQRKTSFDDGMSNPPWLSL